MFDFNLAKNELMVAYELAAVGGQRRQRNKLSERPAFRLCGSHSSTSGSGEQ